MRYKKIDKRYKMYGYAEVCVDFDSWMDGYDEVARMLNKAYGLGIFVYSKSDSRDKFQWRNAPWFWTTVRRKNNGVFVQRPVIYLKTESQETYIRMMVPAHED